MAVYFIQDCGANEIKIGHSTGDPIDRLKKFRTGNPRPLKLLVAIPGGAREEGELHDRFADLRGNGEWFRAEPRLLGFIEGLLVTYPDQPKDDGKAEDSFNGFTRGQLLTVLGFMDGWAVSRRRDRLLEKFEIDDDGRRVGEVDDETSLEASDILEEFERIFTASEMAADFTEGVRAYDRGSEAGRRHDMSSVEGILDMYHHTVFGMNLAIELHRSPDVADLPPLPDLDVVATKSGIDR